MSETYQALFSGNPEPVAEAPPEEVSQEAAPVEASEAEPSAGPARGADGKFVAKSADVPAQSADPAPEAAPAAQGASPAAETPMSGIPDAVAAQGAVEVPTGFIPIAAHQELRRELQDLKKTVQERFDAPSAKIDPPAAAPAPDPLEDPEGYERYHEVRAAQRVFAASRRFAVVQHGDELVAKAQEWGLAHANEDVGFNKTLWDSDDPVGLMLTAYRRQQRLERFLQLSDEDFDRSFAGQAPAASADPATALATQPVVALAAASPPSAQTPPRSLASEPSAAGAAPVTIGDEQVFKGLFQKG